MHATISLVAQACLCAMSLLPIAGCGRGTEASVTGNVTLDGSPLDDATISFVPLAQEQRKAGWTTIREGKYAIPASSGLGTGQFRVEIRALRSTGEKNGQTDPTLPVPAREAVPGRYNSKSELVANIKPGENRSDFELKSK
jgi:hypothetical protein